MINIVKIITKLLITGFGFGFGIATAMILWSVIYERIVLKKRN